MTVSMHNRLTEKLLRIRSGAYSPSDFIIADAKDAEMGGGIGALGTVRLADGTERPATSSDYRQAMIEMMASGLVDIMLTSISSAEALADNGAYSASDVTQGHIRCAVRTVVGQCLRRRDRSQHNVCLLYTSPSPRDRG